MTTFKKLDARELAERLTRQRSSPNKKRPVVSDPRPPRAPTPRRSWGYARSALLTICLVVVASSPAFAVGDPSSNGTGGQSDPEGNSPGWDAGWSNGFNAGYCGCDYSGPSTAYGMAYGADFAAGFSAGFSAGLAAANEDEEEQEDENGEDCGCGCGCGCGGCS
jgi:hypothetical protein